MLDRMIKNKENLGRANPAPTDAEINLAVEGLSPNWTRAVPRQRTGGKSYILQSLAHGRSHAVVLEIKRSLRRLRGSG
jgi:hypothetical protein